MLNSVQVLYISWVLQVNILHNPMNEVFFKKEVNETLVYIISNINTRIDNSRTTNRNLPC